MECRYFGACGSCTLYALSYKEQLARKQERAASLLSPFYNGSLEVYDSPKSHYRARAEFRIRHENRRCDYAMGDLAKKGSVTIKECPKVIEPIAKRMGPLLDAINASPEILKRKLFGVEFLATTTDECLITMLYHRKLDETWTDEAKVLETSLEAKVMGRSRKQKVVLSDEFVTETLRIEGKRVRYRHYEGGFTQPNPYVNVKMIEWAMKQANACNGGDLLEAYCGLGNFTIPLTGCFNQVLATEISKRSIQAATQNRTLNGVRNVTFVRMASEEMTQALQKVRSFRRLEGVELDAYDFSCVLVDPPRAGLDEATRKLVSGIKHIIYISCNPETLARDLATLTRTHRIQTAAVFDQFPHTEHIESGVFLVKE